jgi:MoaA/NifB/PqqE/SkfB family radical SAM enzyme
MDLNVNLRVSYTLCSYRCDYCDIPHDININKNQVSQKIDYLGKINHNLGIIIETGGEPTISDFFMKFVAQLTDLKNVRFVNITTNISPRKDELKSILKNQNTDKFSLDCTYHPTMTAFEEFFEKIVLIKEMGLSVIIHLVAHPRILQDIPTYIRRFEEIGIKLTLNALNGQFSGNMYPGAYTISEKDFLKKHFYSDFEYRYDLLAESPRGKPCYSGAQSVFIDFDDSVVYRCRIDHSARLGDLKNGFTLMEGAPHCVENWCGCPRDHLWLKEVSDNIERTNSFRLYTVKTGDDKKIPYEPIIKM